MPNPIESNPTKIILKTGILNLISAVSSVNAKTGAVVLVKADLGLGNVDNTSDASKPISTATQTAINGKANSIHTHVKADITDFPTLATVATSGSYADLTNIPATFAPTAHNQAWSTITSTPTTLAGYGITDAALSSHTHTFASLTSKPTTLSGFGITDAAAIGANTFTGAQNLADNELIRPKIKDYAETVSTVSIASNAATLDLETGNVFSVSLNANVTFTFSNPPASGACGSFTLVLTADGTARTITWPAAVKWEDGTAPTPPSTNGKVMIVSFMTVNGGTTWFGFTGGKNF